MPSWLPVEPDSYRVNRVKGETRLHTPRSLRDESDLLEKLVEYAETPRDYILSDETTTMDVHTLFSDLYRSPHNQIEQQLHLPIETIKERHDIELINNNESGLAHNVDHGQ